MTSTFLVRQASILLVLTMLPASEARSQRGILEPTGTEVAIWLRNYGGPGGLTLSVLTQTHRRETKQRMDEIADTLAAFAIGVPGLGPRASAIQSTSLSTLHQAGLGKGGVDGAHRPMPYAGAAERVMRIAVQSNDIGIRGAALSALTELLDKAGLLPFLRKVATSSDRVAYRAVTILSEQTGPEGREIARQLYREGSVTQETARETLNHLAAVHQWR